jgi:hypothetical protein
VYTVTIAWPTEALTEPNLIGVGESGGDQVAIFRQEIGMRGGDVALTFLAEIYFTAKVRTRKASHRSLGTARRREIAGV